jgi:hypothetical protein
MTEKKPSLYESLKRNFLPAKDLANPDYSVTIYQPSRKDINFSVEDSSGGGVNFDMYGTDAETGLTGNRLIRRWRQIAQYPIPAECIEEIVNDAVVLEGEVTKVDTAKLADVYGEEIAKEVEDSFEKIKELLDYNQKADTLFRQFYIDGILPFEAIYNNRKMNDGIIRIDQISPFGLKKIYQIDKKRFVWRYDITDDEEYKNSIGNMDLLVPVEQRFAKTEELQEEQIVIATAEDWDGTKKMYMSPIYKAQKSVNQLHLIEDNLIMYRLTHSSDSRVFHINCGKMSKDKAEAYVARLKKMYEQKKYYDTSTGEVDDQKTVRVIGENYWFPEDEEGRGSSVELLGGSPMNLGELPDLDHFIRQVYTAFWVPKSRRKSIDDSPEVRWSSMGDPNILRDELNFSKKVRNFRRNIEKLFYEFIKRDLIAKKKITMGDWFKIKNKIVFIWESDNYYNTMKEFFILDQKLELLSKVEPFIETGYFTKEWAVRNILKFTREEWEDMQQERDTYRIKNIEFDKNKEGIDRPNSGGSGGPDMGGDMGSEGEFGDENEDGMNPSGSPEEFSGEEDMGGSQPGEKGAEDQDFSDEELVADVGDQGDQGKEASFIKDSYNPNRKSINNLIKEHRLRETDMVRIDGELYVVKNNRLIKKG